MPDDLPDKGAATEGGETSARADWERLRRFLQAHKDDPPTIEGKPSTEPFTGEKRPRKRRPPAGLSVKGGRREMKGYTVTEDQLENLGELQLSTALFFSVGTALLSFWIGVQQNVAFATQATNTAQSWWVGLSWGALLTAVVMYLLGVRSFFKGRSTIGRIKRDTIHD
jgi:hypothetical protein